MKNAILTILITLLFTAPLASKAAEPISIAHTEPTKEKHSSFKSFRKATEKKIGRKLGMFERIGLWYYTKLTPEQEVDKKKANSQALTGFILGVCGLIIFPLLAIPGFFFSKSALTKEKLSPGILEGGNKGLAKAGLILSIVGFLYLFLLLIYIVLIVSVYSFDY